MPANLDQLLDRIFGDPQVKHKLDLFTLQEKNRLQLFEKADRIRIRCMVRGRDFVAKPEEVVRQLVLIHLHYTLGYPIDQLAVEVPVQMGSGVGTKAADVVVYRDPQKIIPYVIAEVKKPGRQDGREQLHSYMNATGAPFGMWTNGGTGKQGVAYEYRTDPNLFADLPRLPAQGETLDDVLEPIRKKDLQPAEDLIGLVKQMQEEVLANAGVNVFEEVFKLFFVKLWDEENASDDPNDDSSVCRFRRTADPPEAQYPRFKRLLDEAAAAYPDIFPPGTDFDLSPEALMVVASVLERVRLTDTDLELIDLTFEYLMSPESKGDKGQYFTPRQVVRMVVKMLNPRMNETMLDPASGPCGFPIHTLLHVRENELRSRYHDWETRVQRYGRRNLFAVDFDGRVARVAKFMMRLAGDGRANVLRMNSLDQREWRRDQLYQRQIAERQFDLIMTNPPFAGTIRHPQILNSYDLGFNETLNRRKSKDELHVTRERKLVNSQTRDVLFLNYCLSKLKPGGRMAIVLPQGNFNNISAEQIRRYVMSQARVLAVVGLDVNTFKPHTGTKTSVLFVQRWAGEEADAWATWYDDLYRHEAALAEYEALAAWREQLLGDGTPEAELPAQICQPPPHPGDPPPPPEDYPIFFATSHRSGRDNSGRYDYLKDEDGQVVLAPKRVLAHDEQGRTVEIFQDRPVLDTDLDQIADAFVAWAQEHNLDFFAPSPSGGPAFVDVVAGAALDISSVSLHRLTETLRLDPEYYQPHYLELANKLSAANPVPVDSFAYVTDGIHGSPEWVDHGGVTYLSAQCVKDNYFVLSGTGQISQDQNSQNPRTQARLGDVLLTTVGTIGNAAVVYEEILPANMDRHLGIIRTRANEDADPYYLATFLNSEFGRFQTFREATGNVQLNLFIDKIKKLYIPVGHQFNDVGEITRLAYTKHLESKALYHQAEQLLLDELGLHDLELSDELHSEATATEAWTAQRLDADYFQAKYNRVLEALKRLRPKYILPLGSLLDIVTNGHTPRYHNLEFGEVLFLTAEHIFDFRIDYDSAKRILAEHHENLLKRTQLQEGDVLITIKGRIGNAVVVEYLSGPTNINQDVALLRLKPGYHPYYIIGFLNSVPGKALIEQICTGQINPFLGLSNLRQILIPIFEEARMNELGQHVQQTVQRAYQSHWDARSLLEEAKYKVETLIENGAMYG